MDKSSESERITEVDSSKDLSYETVDILCQPEKPQEVTVEKTVAHDEQDFKPRDSLRKKGLPSIETVTKQEIPEIKAEPITQVKHLETKESETCSNVEEVQKLPHLVLKSDLSQTKPGSVDKVAPKEPVKLIAKENDSNLKRERKMAEKGTLTSTCT